MYPAKTRTDDTIIFDIGCDKTHEPRFFRRDGAMIDDRCIRRARFVKLQRFILHEAVVIHICAGGDQTIHIDHCLLIEHDAILIDNDDITVCFQTPIDTACLRAMHAVKGNGTAIGLVKFGAFIGCNIKSTPINNCFIAVLVYIDRIEIIADGG